MSESSGSGLGLAEPPRRLRSLTIVLPAFDEEAAIGTVIERLRARYPDTPILVVDDGSTDRTADIVRAHQVRLVRHTENRGYGAAWKSGVGAADTRYIAFFDSDGTLTMSAGCTIASSPRRRTWCPVVEHRARMSIRSGPPASCWWAGWRVFWSGEKFRI